MDTPLVMSIIGPDRPGLVDMLASAVKTSGGNWLESRMCRLGGQFAGILRVSVSEAAREALIGKVKALETGDLSIVIKDAGAESEEGCHEVATVEIVGSDRPGIVSQISNAFARHDVNVEDLTTECRSAPMTGEPLFEAKARVCIPDTCNTSDLRDDLEEIAADLMVDVNFESV